RLTLAEARTVTKILLIRHGHVEGITPERFRGRADVALTAQGMAEARAVARRLASGWRPVKVYHSPLARAVVTGVEIAHACQVPADVLEGLADIDYGAWQWMTHEEAKA